MWNQNGQPLLFLIGLKVLIIMTSLQNFVVSGAQGLLMLMGSNFLIKMTRPQNINVIYIPRKYSAACSYFIMHLQPKKFSSININRPWMPKITWSKLFQFHILFNNAFLVLGRSFIKPCKSNLHYKYILFRFGYIYKTTQHLLNHFRQETVDAFQWFFLPVFGPSFVRVIKKCNRRQMLYKQPTRQPIWLNALYHSNE